ncbi:p53-like transcription factor [Hesseltinella vesiculosa]|uniref:p53-like transcription factor n=1 Tax=Hesseltinella vesiculosa TaxID=101127 RepID=A0A1X2GWD2_9FUNG|nr:p53-like transcription factor [Hesseltinella vesiculosa]
MYSQEQQQATQESAHTTDAVKDTNFPSASMSQPTTPKPSSQPSSPVKEDNVEASPSHIVPSITSPSSQVAPGLPHGSGPYMLNHPRRKRRDSDYTADGPIFSDTTYNSNIYHPDRANILDVRIHSKVDRGFFLADNDWTCYRRNYFQVSCAFSLQGVMVLYDGQELPCVVRDPDDDGFYDIEQFYVGMSARLSDCDKQISLVQHTAKRDKGPQSTPTAKPIRPGGNLTFSSVGANHSIVTFERIQFKSATANNGKRRAAQQYYLLVMDLFAKARGTGKLIHVASTQSQHLVVRGRSPGHYAENPGTPALMHAPPPPPPPHPGFYDPAVAAAAAAAANSSPTGMTAGGPLRHHHPPQHRMSPNPAMHPSNFNSGPPSMLPPGGPSYPHPMYSSDYPSYYHGGPPHAHPPGAYPPYAPSHAGVPMHTFMPHPYPSSRPDGMYDPPTSTPYTSLPPPMHRSESAPSAYDHIKDDQQWARARMSSTPGHAPYYSQLPPVPYYPPSSPMYGPSHHQDQNHWQPPQSPQQPPTDAANHVNEYQAKQADSDKPRND